MALEGTVKLTWEFDPEHNCFNLYGTAENENGETKKVETELEIYGDEEECDQNVYRELWYLYKNLVIDDALDFVENSWISYDDPFYNDMSRYMESDEPFEEDDETIDAYFDRDEIDELISVYREAVASADE